MASGAAPTSLATQARRLYTEELVKGLAPLVQAVCEGARSLLEKPSDRATGQRRRDLVADLLKGAQPWHRAIVEGLRSALLHGVSTTRTGELPPGSPLSLVDDDTIELEILSSRLALAIMDRASWEFSDLRSRVAYLEGRAELDAQDLLRAHVLARIVVDAWRQGGQTLDGWRQLQPLLHDEFAPLVDEAYHEANRWLVTQRVLAEVDLRPAIKRSRGVSPGLQSGFIGNSSFTGGDSSFITGTGFASGTGFTGPVGGGFGSGGDRDRAGGAQGAPGGGQGGSPASFSSSGGGSSSGSGAPRGFVSDETRMMTRISPLQRGGDAEAVLGRLGRLIDKQVPQFSRSTRAHALSPALATAIDAVEAGLRGAGMAGGADTYVTTPALLDDLLQRKLALKKAAATPEERATIEIVALLFQSILTEERIPASVRVWFARLQMPVLRVAVSEPDFFATTDHPARRLIDRMGACVMGFDSASRGVDDALEREVKRVVQVVEAYPDTGRRVFQTVLTEFEKFLEHYFRHENEASKKGVSLAQQVEQRETLAIQFTIELRKMLNEVPVQEGVRQYLFQTWADVLATTAVRFGAASEQTRTMKRAAADLIWSASAKVTRDERAEVIRRLPPLLKSLRVGMAAAGLDTGRQDEQIRNLNSSLAAAFTAKAAVIPHERLQELMERLDTLEELLPEVSDAAIDESLVIDLSGHESNELEVVADGGSMPTPPMVAWARELQVGTWYMLDYRGRHEAVQLAWHGLRKQLSLFVSQQGRCVLFQQQRLAGFLQAGLLLPAQDEALTVRATRSALAKLDVDPDRLLL